MTNEIPMIGKRFGRLVVIERGEKPSNSSQAYWICQCNCGNITKPIFGSSLRLGRTKSCGCIHREELASRKNLYGEHHERLHGVWNTMKQRCSNPNHCRYKDYGARGIKVCDEWRNSFKAFYEWAIANGYSVGLSIDRIDVDGNYCPENCRWATMLEQRHNRRDSN